MKILNLFAGIGGNRKLWDLYHNVTSVEMNPIIAACYLDNYPGDNVIVQDVFDYLKNNSIQDYDFIWASPPCVTHSRWNLIRNEEKVIPDLNSLYGLMIFLEHHFKNKWIVENVRPWYNQLKNPTFKLGRHYFWSNFHVQHKKFSKLKINCLTFSQLTKEYNLKTERLRELDAMKRRQVLRNCVDPEIGSFILNQLETQNLTEWIVAK